MDSKTLKPCPFCGGEASACFTGGHFVRCDLCHSSTAAMSESSAIAAWNTRPSPWVSVEERLPEIGDVWDGKTYVAYFTDGNAGFSRMRVNTDVGLVNHMIDVGKPDWQGARPTMWRYLEPPESDNHPSG